MLIDFLWFSNILGGLLCEYLWRVRSIESMVWKPGESSNDSQRPLSTGGWTFPTGCVPSGWQIQQSSGVSKTKIESLEFTALKRDPDRCLKWCQHIPQISTDQWIPMAHITAHMMESGIIKTFHWSNGCMKPGSPEHLKPQGLLGSFCQAS